MSNFLFSSWIFVHKNFSCFQDFGCTTTPAAKAIHRVPTSLGLQSKQTHWISPKLVPAPEECSPVLFPYPWLHFRAELHTSQSSKETLPKVSDSFNISIQRSVYVWECAAQPYGSYGKTCYCTMIQKAGCKKIHMGQTLFNLDFHANRLLLWLWKPLQGQDIQDMYFVEEGSVCLFVRGIQMFSLGLQSTSTTRTSLCWYRIHATGPARRSLLWRHLSQRSRFLLATLAIV